MSLHVVVGYAKIYQFVGPDRVNRLYVAGVLVLFEFNVVVVFLAPDFYGEFLFFLILVHKQTVLYISSGPPKLIGIK